MTLKIENLDAHIATALEHSSLMRLLDAAGKACGTDLTSKNWGKARELNGGLSASKAFGTQRTRCRYAGWIMSDGTRRSGTWKSMWSLIWKGPNG